MITKTIHCLLGLLLLATHTLAQDVIRRTHWGARKTDGVAALATGAGRGGGREKQRDFARYERVSRAEL